MKRVLSLFGIFLAVLVVVAAGAYSWAGAAAKARMERTWPEVRGKSFPIPFPLTDDEIQALRAEKLSVVGTGGEPATVDDFEEALEEVALARAVERGRRLAHTRLGCVDCHGATGEGGLIANAQPVWTWYAPNITTSGPVARYSAADWDRLIRHGIMPDGRNATMPAIDYQRLADRDVSDLAAWARSLPPSDHRPPQTVLGPVGRVLMATGQLLISAELIDHEQEPPELPPASGVNAAFGGYVAQSCVGCHGETFSGGPIPGGDPKWPPAANLTPHEDGLGGWTEEDWMHFWVSGERPDGSSCDPSMPWKSLGQMPSVDLRAMFVYFTSLEPRPTGR